MSLLTDHEAILEITLEDTELFGVPIEFKSPDDSTFSLNGQVNIISRHISVDTGSDIVSERSNITVRLSSLQTALGITNVDVIKTGLKKYRITTSPQPGTVPDEEFVIEDGGVFPDSHLGIVTIFLTKLENTA
ncbi:hypothetical protein KAR91_30305 [Candidatus Pacearchaeota archaeon]|nr:hypothetical protein [Candidatus Pacearchaeota archaeon]